MTVVINTAKAIYAGGSKAKAVYSGRTKVWPTKQVRVTFQAGYEPLIINNASIGIQAATGNVWDTTETPVELLFGGQHGFNFSTAYGTITSDWADLDASSAVGTVLSRSFGSGSTGGGWGGYSVRTILGPVLGLSTSLVVSMDLPGSATSMAGIPFPTDQTYYFGPWAPLYNLATPSGGNRSSTNTNSVVLIETK